MTQQNLQLLASKALAIRIDTLRATTQAASGHPTSCLSAADIVSVLYFHTLRYDYSNPTWHNNDRFILSKGHAVPVVYAALHALGVISEQQLLSYRKIDSDLEGHPTPRFAYNEAATGSLGQGLSVGLGMALHARLRKLSYRTYVMLGDAEIAEGSIWEAVELAAHYKVDNLVGILDCNRLGQSDVAMHEHNVARHAQKFTAFGWKTIVIDGHDIKQIIDALDQAQSIKQQPVMIIAKTFKGYGIDGVQDNRGFHGKPFKKDELPTVIEKMKQRFAVTHTSLKEEIIQPPKPDSIASKSMHNIESLQLNLAADSAYEYFAQGKKISTRKAFGYALASLGKTSDRVVVCDGDVKNSTFTELFEKVSPERFFQCFVAEQNMIGVATGLTQRGDIAFASTFASFFSRCYDQVRMAAIGRVPLRLCGSHSGVSIGQDGPSQMGLEDVAMMRAIPDSVVLWPSDGVSTYKLVEKMALHTLGISYLKTTRADTPILYDEHESFDIGGSKVLRSTGNDKACIAAAGVTVHEALKAYEILQKRGISVAVVDVYSIKPLDAKTLLAIAAKSQKNIITVEDHYPAGGLGEALMSALSNKGIAMYNLAVHELPRSGSPEELLQREGIDAQAIVKIVESLH